VRFSTREVQKHHKRFWGNPCQKLLAEKVEDFVSCRLFFICFYRLFGRFTA
jgi:hypothetical protein